MFKKLAGQTALYGVSSIVGRMINYLLTPLYSVVFLAEENGSIAKFYAFAAFMNVVYTFGMETTYFRFAARRDQTEQDKTRHYQQATTLLLMVGLLLTTMLWLGADLIAYWLNEEGGGRYLRWLSLIMLVDALAALPLAQLRLEGRPLKFAAIKLLGVVLIVCLNLLFYYFGKLGITGYWGPEWVDLANQIYDPAVGIGYIFLGNLVANTIVLLCLFPSLLKIRLRWDEAEVRVMLSYAWPLFVMGLAGMIDEMMSRTFLEHLLPVGFYGSISNKAALGVFSQCYKLSIFMSLAIQAFRYTADPFFFSRAEDKQAPQLFSQVMHAFVLVCLLLFMGVCLNLWWLAPLILRRPIYLTGLDVVPILLLANMSLGIYYNLTVWFKLTDKTRYGTYIALYGAAITIIANILLIPIAGYVGSSLATLFCYASMSFVCWKLGQRYWPIPYQWAKTLPYIALAIVLVYTEQLLGNRWNWWQHIGYASCSLAVFAAYLFKVEKLSLQTIVATLKRKS